MMHKVNYLRAYRKQSEIRQSDMAFLLDLEASPNLSRYEKGRRFPPMDMILVYHMILDTPIHSFFSIQRNAVKQQLLIRMRQLVDALSHQEQTSDVEGRIKYLNAAFIRLNEEGNNENKQ